MEEEEEEDEEEDEDEDPPFEDLPLDLDLERDLERDLDFDLERFFLFLAGVLWRVFFSYMNIYSFIRFDRIVVMVSEVCSNSKGQKEREQQK